MAQGVQNRKVQLRNARNDKVTTSVQSLPTYLHLSSLDWDVAIDATTKQVYRADQALLLTLGHSLVACGRTRMWFVLSAVDMYTGVGCDVLIAGLRVEVYNSRQNVDHGSATGAWGVGK